MAEETDDRWENLRYIDKLARVVRHGRALSPDDDVDALAAMTPEQVVDHFMADPRFIDTVLDFNLYFLGFRPSAIRQPDGALDPLALDSWRAVTSALEVKRGGDYLSLLARRQDVFVKPSYAPFQPDPGSPVSDTEARKYWLELALSEADKLIALSEAGAPIAELCEAFFNNQAFSQFFGETIGLSYEFANLVSVHPKWFLPYLHSCISYSFPIDFTAVTHDVRERLPELHALAEEVAAQGYIMPKKVEDVHMVDLERLDMEDVSRRLEQASFWDAAPNSSTNYNRRRAAYILDRFFCDDLKPINAALPEVHVGDSHASDPGCASCHYKLDPMAGFFKDHGWSGVDFSEYNSIMFSDLAVMDRDTYQAS